MKQHEDPTSTKYPDRRFYAGRWRTPEQIEAHLRRTQIAKSRYRKTAKGRAAIARSNSLTNARQIRMRAGGIEFYLGLAPTTEEAQHLRRKIRKEAPRGLA